MTDDEAFIRAIVDSPGDDLPRLVYADWLDERGDPRGAYLRAERSAYRDGDVSPMRGLASGLDPVWVARVTLPPYETCLHDERFEPNAERPAGAELGRLEKEAGVVIPCDYKAFALNYNGGRFRSGGWDTPQGVAFESEYTFLSLGELAYPLRLPRSEQLALQR